MTAKRRTNIQACQNHINMKIQLQIRTTTIQSERYNNQVEEPSNPYDDGSGHSAGYEWAQENDPSSCGGNSDSFIEGCQEYLDQQEAYEDNESEEN
jgi:hypothetical protein